MAVRYVEIGQYPDVRREVRGNLSEILVATANPGTYAAPEDVTGCFLEMGADGKWDGASVGSFESFEVLDALPTAYLAFGARASVNSVQYTYGAAGWVVSGVISLIFEDANSADANTQAIQYALDSGVDVSLSGSGVAYISSALRIRNQRLDVGGVILTAIPTMVGSLVINKGFDAMQYFVASLTAARGVATAYITGNPFAVRDVISVSGADGDHFNGVWIVDTSIGDAVTFKIQSLDTLTATGVLLSAIGDDSVEIVGNGVGGFDYASRTAGSGLDWMCIRLLNCRVATIRNLKILNSKKYGFYCGQYNSARAELIDFDTGSDGVHFIGPGASTRVGQITGTTADNSVAFTIGDYSAYEVTRGSFGTIEINNISARSPNASIEAIRFVGNTGYRFARVYIAGIAIDDPRSVGVITDTGLLETTIDVLKITCASAAGDASIVSVVAGVQNSAVSVGTLIVDGVIRNNATTGNIVRVGSTLNANVVIGSIRVSGVRDYSPASPGVLVNATGTTGKVSIRSISLDDVVVTGQTDDYVKVSGAGSAAEVGRIEVNGTFDLAYNGVGGSGLVAVVGTNTTVDSVRISGMYSADATKTTTTTAVAYIGTTQAILKDLLICDMVVSDAYRLMYHLSTTASNVSARNVRMQNCNRGIEWTKAAGMRIVVDDCIGTGMTYGIVRTNGSTAINNIVKINGSVEWNVSPVTFISPATGYVDGLGTPVDLVSSNISGAPEGVVARNSNASLSCGLGAVQRTATNWTNMATGATY